MTITQLMTMGPSSIIERFDLSFSDLTAAATTQQIVLKALPKGTIIKGVRIKLYYCLSFIDRFFK